MTKEELKEILCSNKLSGNGSREWYWIKKLPAFYNELLTWQFPDDFSFLQKVYHYLNDDPELNLGICPECGKRCRFRFLTTGYHTFCSNKCATKSDNTKLKIKQTCLEKYGVEHAAQSEDVKEKVKQTCLERYGVEYYLQTDDSRNKSKQTKLERYNDENYSNKEKQKQTCLEKYGKEYYSQTDEWIDKVKETCLEKYNKEYYSQTNEYKERYEQTSLERYGVENPVQSEEVKEKRKQTCLEKYGKEFYFQTDEFKKNFEDYCWLKNRLEKVYQTKKKNNTFNTSKIEEQIKQYLDDNNIPYIYQYTSDKYPFSCDFYFPDKDLYVEIQGTWTHGFKPFENTEDDLLLLEKWKSKYADFYKNAIETWTVRDVRKREIAKQNNLNWIEIFSIDLETCINEILKHI